MSKELKLHNSFYYKNNRLQQIRGFCNTVIFGSSVKAAEFMHLTQASISVQISSLEECLNLKLFRKKGRSLELTEDGKRFYDYIIPVLKAVDGAYEEFIAINYRENENKLRIGAYHYAISRILPRKIAKLYKNHPNLDILIENISKSEAINKLRATELDLIIYPFKGTVPQDFNIIESIIFKPAILAHKDSKIAKKDKITIEDIRNENLLLTDRETILPEYVSILEMNDIDSSVKFKNMNWEMIRFFVRENLGITFFGDIGDVQYETDDVRMLHVDHLFPMLEYQLCTRSNIGHSVMNFLNLMKD
jgi:DNA-binding transcriptional LysR family regulator